MYLNDSQSYFAEHLLFFTIKLYNSMRHSKVEYRSQSMQSATSAMSSSVKKEVVADAEELLFMSAFGPISNAKLHEVRLLV